MTAKKRFQQLLSYTWSSNLSTSSDISPPTTPATQTQMNLILSC